MDFPTCFSQVPMTSVLCKCAVCQDITIPIQRPQAAAQGRFSSPASMRKSRSPIGGGKSNIFHTLLSAKQPPPDNIHQQ